MAKNRAEMSSHGTRSEAVKIGDLSQALVQKFLHVDKDLEKQLVGDLVKSLISLARKIGPERLTEYKTVLVEGASAYPFAWFLWSLASRIQGAKDISPLPALAPYGTGRREKVNPEVVRRIAEDVHGAQYPEPMLIASDVIDSGGTMKSLVEGLEKAYGRKLRVDAAGLSAGMIDGVLTKSKAAQHREWLKRHVGNLFTESNTLLAEPLFVSLAYRTGFEKEVGAIRPKAADLSNNRVVTAWIDAMEYAAAAIANDMLKKR